MMKKLIALLLAALMIVGMFAGCTESKQDEAAEAPKAEGAATEAKSEQKEEPTTIEWYIGSPPQENQDAVFAAINEILVEELNVKVNFHLIDFSEYGQKMQILMGSGEPIDMMWTSNWTNDFYADAAKNAYQELDMDMIKEYGPNIMAEVPAGAWAAGVVNGKPQAIPNVQVLARWPALFVQTKFLEKYDVDPSTIKEIDDLTPLLQQIADNDKDYYAMGAYKGLSILSFMISNMGMEYFSESSPFGIRIDDENLEVINLYETEEMRSFLNTLRSWYQTGIIRPDAASVTDISAEKSNGLIAASWGVNNPDTLVNQARLANLKPEDLTAIPVSDPYLATSSIVATMTAINVNSTKAKECIQVLNKFFDPVDTRCINLLSWGIEGVNYNKVEGEDDLIELIPDSGYCLDMGWAYGCLFNCYRSNPTQPKWRPAGPDINNNAVVSPMLGFSFNPENVKNQLAQIAAVMNEYVPALQTGSVDVDSTLEEFLAKLETAGAADVQAELQSQLDAWKAAK